jgi:hypothetical protein
MNPGKIWITKRAGFLLLLISALALAMPAFAQIRPPGLSDSQEPGSVIIFKKFIKGVVTLPEGGLAPRSELELGVVCPKGFICSEHLQVKIRAHWVCGTGEFAAATSFVCRETDFDIICTVFEKCVLTPDGTAVTAVVPTKVVPAAPCDRGYLIAWVIRAADDQPIKFDGLVGDGVLREAGTALAAYNAIPIQADPALATNGVIAVNGNGALIFDGGRNHYQMVTNQVIGDVRYSNNLARAADPILSDGSLTLFTLDVKSNRPNNPVFVDLDFFGGNPSLIGNENQLSTFTEFICWVEIRLLDIDANLNAAFMGRKGVVVSGKAEKVGIFGIQDEIGPATLLGMFETTEGPAANLRAYYFDLYNDSEPVPTRFRPGPSPIFLSP